MHTASRPVLPPLHYVLFMPRQGCYVRSIDVEQRTFKATADHAGACSLIEPDAIVAGRELGRAIRSPIELRLPVVELAPGCRL
ncbi:hypothetical protein BH11PSE9_BH11PSE9_21080 [soil metagenome]